MARAPPKCLPILQSEARQCVSAVLLGILVGHAKVHKIHVADACRGGHSEQVELGDPVCAVVRCARIVLARSCEPQVT